MLLNDFYTIQSREMSIGSIRAKVEFNRDHSIFEGHFPGNPIVPGVCMIQLVREIVALSENKTVRIAKGENIKFLSVINPVETPVVDVLIIHYVKENSYVIDASLFLDQVTYFKFKGSFQIV